MPYFCEYPLCQCHVGFNDDRPFMRVIDGVKEDTFTLKEIGHKTFQFSNRNSWDYFYLCDECVEKLTEQNFLNNPELTRWYHKRTMR